MKNYVQLLTGIIISFASCEEAANGVVTIKEGMAYFSNNWHNIKNFSFDEKHIICAWEE